MRRWLTLPLFAFAFSFASCGEDTPLYIDAGFTQDLPALAPNLCGWVAGSFYDREKGEDHYYVWFNREMDAPPSMCARIVSESGTNWLDAAWVDWAVTNWIDKTTGRVVDAPPTASDYVQDGLVAMWDGIENVGWGQHDSAATVWNDLVNNVMFYNISPSGWTENALDTSLFTKYPITDSQLVGIGTGDFSIQVCGVSFALNGNTIIVEDEYANSAFSIQSSYGSGRIFSNWLNTYPHSFIYTSDIPNTANAPYFATACYSAGSNSVNNFNGNSLVNSFSSSQRPHTGVIRLGRSGLIHKGIIYGIRFYSKTLTAAEIARNYAIDRARFFNDISLLAVPCRELVVPRRNANCVLKTGTVITFGGKDGFDADIHKVNIEVGGEPTVTTSAQLPLFYAVTRSGTNTVTRVYTNGFLNVENGFIKEPTNE